MIQSTRYCVLLLRAGIYHRLRTTGVYVCRLELNFEPCAHKGPINDAVPMLHVTEPHEMGGPLFGPVFFFLMNLFSEDASR